MSSVTHHDHVISPSPSSPAAEKRPASRLWQWIGQAVPTAAVIAALAGLAIWGHSTEWKVPKFSALIGEASGQQDDWCAEHSVPESQCIECNKDLVSFGKDYGWCKECGVAQCPLHHPDVAQLKSVPTMTEEDFARVQRALNVRARAENNSRCVLHERHIQFASIEALDKAGVDIAVAAQHPIVEAITANGEVVYDQTKVAQLASRVAGTVWRVEKQLGDRVQKGEILALIDAAAVGRAKEELLQAIAHVRLKQATLDRLAPLAADQAVPLKQVREAEAALEEARIRLQGAQQSLINLDLEAGAEDLASLTTEEVTRHVRSLGLPRAVASGTSQGSTSSNLFPLRAPQDGVVVACSVVPGNVVDTSATIFGVADIGRMWVTLNVRQEEVKYLSLGQTVLFRTSDSREEPEIKGSLAWISTEADDQTRTVEVRVNLPNEDGRLRAHTFGTGRIVLREEPQAVVVPTEAVHRDGDCNVVFVRDKNFFQEGTAKFFHIRKVRLGVQEDGLSEIIVGLVPGEVIAAKNSVVLQAQLLKGNLGEGCCGHHH